MPLENSQKSAYENIWNYLNSPQDSEQTIPVDLKATYAEVINFFAHNNKLKTISLNKENQEDINYLASINIKKEYVITNFRSRVNLVTHDNQEFQNRAVQQGYVYCLYPITGDILRSNISIPVNESVFFYRFVSTQVFYLITDNLGAGYPKDGFYFPQHDLIIREHGHRYGVQEAHIIILKALLVTYSQEFSQYFADQNPKKIASIIGNVNFAHHLWNELSALERLKQNHCLQKVEKIFVLRETLGKISDIFPEIDAAKISYSDSNSYFDKETTDLLDGITPLAPEIILDILKNHYFCVHLGDRFIPHRLTQQLYKVAKEQVSPNILETIDQAKEDCFPLLWISIRQSDRTWVNQTQGLTEVIKALAKKFPRLGIVFDGFTFPSDCLGEESLYKPTAQQIEIVNQEKAIVQEIIEGLDVSLPIYNLIGSSLFEANLWAHAIDLYLCHFGTLQHKVAWFALKPGIVHCNARVSANKNSQNRCYNVREFGIRPLFFDPADITTINLDYSGGDLRTNVDNYDLDRRVVYQKALELIEEVEKANTWTGKLRSSWCFMQKYLRGNLAKMPYLKRYASLINP